MGYSKGQKANPPLPVEQSKKEQDPARAANPGPNSLLDDILSHPAAATNIQGLIVGVISGWSEEGLPLVEFEGNPDKVPQPARSLVALGGIALNSPVALLFEQNNPRAPLVIGLIQAPSPQTTARLDDEEVVLEAKERIELRCGKARIVLTKDGKVLIKGKDVMSRSEGPNRIKGASIQIN